MNVENQIPSSAKIREKVPHKNRPLEIKQKNQGSDSETSKSAAKSWFHEVPAILTLVFIPTSRTAFYTTADPVQQANFHLLAFALYHRMAL